MKISSKSLYSVALLSLIAGSVVPAFAGPRDAVAVLNRCGKPLKGDEIIYENTVAGGRRILSYERGILHFDRQLNDGWTFKYGTHKKQDNLDAEEMAKFMPCLTDALKDSAAEGPIKQMTEAQRVVYDAKTEYKKIIFYGLGGLVVVGVVLAAWPKSKEEEEV
jgi:hypothetical protein